MESFGGMVGSFIQMQAADKATKAQVRAGREQMDLYRDIFDYSKDIQAPFVDAGTLANAALMYELGLGEAPTISRQGYEVGGTTYETREQAENALREATNAFNRQSTVRTPTVSQSWGKEGYSTGRPKYAGGGRLVGAPGQYTGYDTSFAPERGIEAAGYDPRGAAIEEVGARKYQGFQKTPDYHFALEQGQNTVTSSAAARGGLKSGATLKALTEYGQNYANLRRDNYLAQLAGITGRGQASTNALQSAGNAFAAGSGGAIGAIGNAKAAGAIAQGNYASQAVQQGFQAVGSFGSMMGGGGGGMMGGGGGGFGSIASQLLGSGGFGGGGGMGGFNPYGSLSQLY